MMSCLNLLIYINKSLHHNHKRSLLMSSSQLRQPFQYEKIPIDQVQIEQQHRPTNTWQTIKRIGTYLIKHKWKLLLVIMMVISSSALGLLGPYLIGMAIDDFIVTKQTAGLLTLIIWLVFIFIGHSTAIPIKYGPNKPMEIGRAQV